MKFGRNYHRNQVPEWSHAYLNYRASKRLCKHSDDPQEVSIHLVREINKVSEFYDEIYNALTRKAKTRYRGLLLDYSAPVLNPAGLDHCELEHNLVTFVEFRQDLEKLRWFGRVNVDGFRKLLRKLGTRSVGHDPSIKDIAVRLGKLQFATQGQCLVDMEKLDGHIRSLDSVRTRQNSREELFYQRISHISSLLPSAALLYQAIAADDDAVLVDQLDNSREPGSVSSLSATIPFLLQLSIRLKSSSCVSAILARLGRGDSPTDSEVISDGIHNIILELGRAKAARHLPAENPLAKTTFEYTATISLLRFILERLPANHRPVLRLQDSVERLPLHYACEYGLAEVCQILLGYMKMWGQICVGTSESPVLVPDAESHTPLHLAVMGGHVDATAILIESHKKSCDRDDPAHHGHALSFTTTSSELLIIAAKSESSEMVQLLLSTAGADVNHSTDLGETSLYIAARSGNEDLVKLLLDRNAKADMREKDENWTPLITACVYGYLPVAKLLLETKADILHYDRSNWTAIDHASYRGHIPLAKELWEAARNSTANCPPRQLNHPTIPVRGQPRRSISTIKSYVVVNLVSFDAYKPLPDYFNTASYSDHGSLFSLSISALDVMGIESEGPGRTVHLPLLEDTTNAPWIFSTRDPRKSKLVFELFRVTSDKPIGTGIALLDNLKNAMGVTRESLNRNFTIPILSKETMEFTGAVTFNFLVSTPIVLPDTLPIETEHLWHERGPTKVVGHRGRGQNFAKHTYLEIGENTIQSFMTAVDVGASYVELDVQLTKDHVPVIYHDFLVCEIGSDSPMHTLSYAQFMHISHEQSYPGSASSSPSVKAHHRVIPSNRVRSRSLTHHADVGVEHFRARMKHTFDFSGKGFKGNTKGDSIHDAFITLEELLTKLPLSIGLDIEIKYPMLSEAADDWHMDIYAVEVNLFVDTILLCIARHVSTRPIFFCSFSPEVCILLALKQARWPITFANDSGNWQPSSEIRACNLQEGVRFAKAWNLDGLALASEPLVMAPGLTGFVKAKGLVVASYGAWNNEPEYAKIQAEAGLDIIIVDNTRLISEALAR